MKKWVEKNATNFETVYNKILVDLAKQTLPTGQTPCQPTKYPANWLNTLPTGQTPCQLAKHLQTSQTPCHPAKHPANQLYK